MKFNSTNEGELNSILGNIPNDSYIDQYIITRIINPTGRIKFKDVRKISIGLSKKDIISYRGKQKGPFIIVLFLYYVFYIKTYIERYMLKYLIPVS